MKSSRKIEPGLYETEEGDRIRWQESPGGWLLIYAGETDPVEHLYATKAEILRELDGDVAPAPDDWETWSCPKPNCTFSIQQPPCVQEISHKCGAGKRTVLLEKLI